ncbi:MAG: phytanoyl-CoA dioxygenase family protein [Bryobacterales bacterium]|nr:phytanoyl-CoA dioxygenase family protein [Bryobacterales bacterium]
MEANARHKLHHHLGATTRLAQEQLADRVRQAQSKDYWRALNLQFTIGGACGREGLTSGSAGEPDFYRRRIQFAGQGFTTVPSLVAADRTAAILQCFDSLRRAGWPLVFAFVYDELWEIAYSEQVLGAAERLAGSCRPGSLVWAQRLHPSRGSAGWPPHDCCPSGHLFSLWVHLTPSTPRNGCQYILPLSAPAGIAERLRQRQPMPFEDVISLLQAAQPAEAQAGDCVFLRPPAMTWGSANFTNSSGAARLCFTFTQDGPALEEPAGFEARLRAIGQSLLTFKIHEPLMERYAGLAEALASLTEVEQ